MTRISCVGKYFEIDLSFAEKIQYSSNQLVLFLFHSLYQRKYFKFKKKRQFLAYLSLVSEAFRQIGQNSGMLLLPSYVASLRQKVVGGEGAALDLFRSGPGRIRESMAAHLRLQPDGVGRPR